jgi:hypothetical protein
MTAPYGPAALTAYRQARALVEQGKYDEARAVEMLPSDRKVIERRIAERMAASAKGNTE